jgi:phospholipase C
VTPFSRRSFIVNSALAATAAATVNAPRAAATRRQAGGSGPRTGTIADVEHVVIVMQENRSFDHYYGSMKGVLGFDDSAALTYPDGTDIYQQPISDAPGAPAIRPYRMDTRFFNTQQADDLDHSWEGTHQARNDGAWNRWIPAKTTETMGFFTREDIPWQYALADYYTICDQYFCSISGPTMPNRLFQWSGTVDPAGKNGGPATANPPDYVPVYSWTTYPERLHAAGISWKTYANDEVGDGDGDDGWVGDYGDNPLWLFHQYHDSYAASGQKQDMAVRGALHGGWKPNSGRGRDVDYMLSDFIADVAHNALPTVSYVVSPYLYSEHPRGRPADGANYLNKVLSTLWSNPQVWERTVVLINFDENDGFYDHVIPPSPPAGTPDEFINGLPIGLGPRVPMTVVSPWSTGGWTSSHVYDHTSVLQFLEKVTGVKEPNISAWRRSVCGDLTQCFDFTSFDPQPPQLPDATALVAAAEGQTHLPAQPLPTMSGEQPHQEPGSRNQRPSPYGLTVRMSGNSVALSNGGTANMPVGVYYTMNGGQQSEWLVVDAKSSANWTVPAGASAVVVYGPAGFRQAL